MPPRRPIQQPQQPNPALQDVWNTLQTEKRPLAIQDFQGYDSKVVASALNQLHQAGYVYPIEGLWAPTQAMLQAEDPLFDPSNYPGDSPAAEIIDISQLPIKTFIAKAFMPAITHFLSIHPEYGKVITAQLQSEHSKTGFAGDVQSLLSGKYVKFMPSNKSIPKYEYPEMLSSVEQAIAEMISEMQKYHPQLKGKLPSVAANKNASDLFSQIMQAQGPQLIASILNSAGGRFGNALSVEDIQGAITRSEAMKLIAGKRVNKETFQNYLYNAVVNSTYAKEHDILIVRMDRPTTIDILSRQITSNKGRAGEIVNNFRKSLSGGGIEELSFIFSGYNFPNTNLSESDLSGVTLSSSDFTSSDFSRTKFDKAKIRNCDLSQAKFIDAGLNAITAFTDNNIEGTDFKGAGLKKNFPDESNQGNPINLNFREIEHSKEGLQTALSLKNHSVHSLPLEEEELGDARAVAKALEGVLQHRSIVSSLSLIAMSEDEATQFKQWIADPSAIPSFLPSENVMEWLVERNKKGELAPLGLSKADVNKLFGRARNLTAQPVEKVISPEEQKKVAQDQMVQQFISLHKDAEEFPIDDLLNLLQEPQGELRNFLSAYGPMLSQGEARAILHGLESSLKQYHIPKSITPKKWIKAFPYSTRMSNFSGEDHSVSGGGKQFGVAIRPDMALMSPELSLATDKAINDSGTHLNGALAFSRIMPYHYTEYAVRGNEPPTTKNVWFISEMQSDSYQKGNDEIKEKAQAKAFRDYFRHWPEVLLSAIITQAQKAGIDEIWMPEGKEVVAKTGTSSVKEDSWDYSYDRPAKAYGGVLKSIGENLKLDPGSGYDRTTSMVYVINISGVKKKASLELCDASLFLIAAEIDNYRENLIHHMNYVIDNNLPKFPVIAKYITVDMLAQFAFKTFFEEYGIPEELRNDPIFVSDVKKVLDDEFGVKVWDPPYIDWLYWLQKAFNDVLYYVHNQRHNIQPDMTVTDQELARDWFGFWITDQVPTDMKGAFWFKTKFISTIQALVKGQGLGDILSQAYIPPQTQEERTQQIIHPTDTGEGEKELEGLSGEPLPEEDESLKLEAPREEKAPETNPKFMSPNEKRHAIDKYLDELKAAKEAQDAGKVQEITQKLKELTTASLELVDDSFPSLRIA